MFKERLAKKFEQMNMELDEQTINRLSVYFDMLVEWNKHVNLTAVTDPEEAAAKHFADSASALYLLPQSAKCIDVGTGAGFPGLVAAIIRPDISIVLMDSLKKKLNFIDAVILETKIQNAVTLHSRAEDAARNKDYRQKFDIVFARAVAYLSVTLEYCIPFLKKGGMLVYYGGPSAKIGEVQNVSKLLGADSPEVKNANVPGLNHYLVTIRKIKDTPSQYPRKAGIPAKEPLK